MPYLSMGREQLYYHMEPGNQSKAIIFLHSLGTDHRLWQYQIEHLAREGYTIVAPDARGHGESTCHAGISVDLWVEDILQLIDHLELEKVVLCGISMGGVEAMAFALQHPDRVHALILADTFAKIDPSEIPNKIKATAGLAEEQGMERYADSYLDNTLSSSASANQIRESLRKAIANMSVEAYKASAESCFGIDLEEKLSELTIPSLILIGEEDYKTPIELSQIIKAKIPNAILQIVPGGMHLSNVDQPESFNQLLIQYLDRCF